MMKKPPNIARDSMSKCLHKWKIKGWFEELRRRGSGDTLASLIASKNKVSTETSLNYLKMKRAEDRLVIRFELGKFWWIFRREPTKMVSFGKTFCNNSTFVSIQVDAFGRCSNRIWIKADYHALFDSLRFYRELQKRCAKRDSVLKLTRMKCG